ncbi:MAG: Transcription factor iws1 [Vezdaea aestivalis]|nr:MAG: Transcription factor iws1 [Vezdaea aestivalis]
MSSRSASPSPPQDDAPSQLPASNRAAISDDDSDLSDVDEAQFQDFDVANITAVDTRVPIELDEGTVATLTAGKRKRNAGEEAAKKRKKEGKREKKPKKVVQSDDEDFSGGEEMYGKRRRKEKGSGGGRSGRADDGGEKASRKIRAATPENLSPEERRRRALDKAMEEAVRSQKVRRTRKDGEDLQALADEEIENMRKAMIHAAQADAEARSAGKPAMHKLKLLPAVTTLLARSNLKDSFVDPDTNFLEVVRYFLEPLEDGSLPAYNIQKDLFAALQTLPVDKDALIASGIGKVALFYTKSKRPEPSIKRVAEQLIADWSRPILARPDDYRQKAYETRDFDPNALPIRPSASQSSLVNQTSSLSAAERRDLALATPVFNANRARAPEGQTSYSIVPKNIGRAGGAAGPHMYSRPLGASGDDQFRRLKARQAAARR